MRYSRWPGQKLAVSPGQPAPARPRPRPETAADRLGNRRLQQLVRATARAGVASPGGRLPHLDQVQRSFGPEHDLSDTTAHQGDAAQAAAQALGALAYTSGEHIAFASTQPSPGDVAHEAAHVVQQRQRGAGAGGPADEHVADAVARRVERGEPAGDLLGAPASARASGGGALQRRLVAHGSDADFRAFADLLGGAASMTLTRDAASHVVSAQPAMGPPHSTELVHLLNDIIGDAAVDAELQLGTHQTTTEPGPAGTPVPVGVAGGHFPSPVDMTGARAQLIDMDDIQAMETGAPGFGVATLSHEMWENYQGHFNVPVPNASRYESAHESALLVESDVAAEVAGTGERVALAVQSLGAHATRVFYDYSNRYAVWDVHIDPVTFDNTIVNAHWAPKVPVLTLVIDHFGFDSDAVPAAQAPLVAASAAALLALPGATALVEGFTDEVGSEAYNQDLGQRRADSILAAIARTTGDAGRMFAIGRGEASFVAANATPAGRASNRRVVITISRPGP